MKTNKTYIKSFAVTVVALLLSLGLAGYFLQLPISVEYGTFFVMSIFILIVASVLESMFVDMNESASVEIFTPVKSLTALITVIYLIIVIAGSEMLNAEKYGKLLKVNEVSVSEMKIKATDTRTSNKAMALKAANKVLGTKHNDVLISSQYLVNEESAFIQEIDGKLTWIFPLDYKSIFKWMNQTSIPGYIMVTGTNSNAVATIKLDSEIVYSKNGYFGTNIDREMWLISGMKQVDTHLEINDEGKAFYIGSVLKPLIGFNAYDVEEVIVFDAEIGTYNKYTPEEAVKQNPWIDRIIPEDISLERINWYGEYQDTWLNAITTQENVKEATDYNGAELWFTKINNKNYWFTGMTSVGKSSSKDQSMTDGIVVNTLNGEALIFELPGVTDENGAVQQADSSLGADSIKWNPVVPQPQFIDDAFYWITTIKSNSNLYQKVVAVKGDETTVTFEAKTVEQLIEKIKNAKTENIGSDETITVNKNAYLKLLKKVSEINELVKQLQ